MKTISLPISIPFRYFLHLFIYIKHFSLNIRALFFIVYDVDLFRCTNEINGFQ
ncbi:hypothetical protein BCR42DRAFT_402877 [Absidia repens]|uniref:Uncharacterized protein n=1 Tax=Absidia repens TaxID=90262 RepID=A0A1X2IYN1_9FUNG|nr:hypothetical protein BCR42DRAFT_402877 [Absidia repens]